MITSVLTANSDDKEGVDELHCVWLSWFFVFHKSTNIDARTCARNTTSVITSNMNYSRIGSLENWTHFINF